jgi:aerobic carbon-monoxide dehydrogenase small subunit
MPYKLSLSINGNPVSLAVEPHLTLLELLRDTLGLTGTKEGCGAGNCGACTILLDGEPVNSCLLLAAEADGSEVITVEGLTANGDLHPVQEALVAHGGLQCGFCTPGVILSSVVLLKRNPRPTEAEIRDALAGNLCRCTGYDKIVRAVQAAAGEVSHV